MHKFTVFTPTYDRAHTLDRLFQSLRAQSFQDFEWLIVDDGSTDSTGERVAVWAESAPFSIRYVYQSNAGKHVAFNRAVDAAKGELFLPVDSDDTLTPNALERMQELWLGIPQERRSAFSGVTASCMTANGERLGPSPVMQVLDCSALDAVFRWDVRGERFGFHRTEILRRIRFPVGEALRFVPEGVLWFAIARRYLTRFVDEPLRVYHLDGGQRLTTMADERKGAGLAYYARDLLTKYPDYALLAPIPFLKAAVHYMRFRHLLPPGVPSPRWPAISKLYLGLAVVPATVLSAMARALRS
jgi:glycosyltransferase involved in cell wall biosynthesis